MIFRASLHASLSIVISIRAWRACLHAKPWIIVCPSRLGSIAYIDTCLIRPLTKQVWGRRAISYAITCRVVSKLIVRTYSHTNSQQNISVCSIWTSFHTCSRAIISIVIGRACERAQRNTASTQPICKIIRLSWAILYTVSSTIISKPTKWALKDALPLSSIYETICGRHQKTVIKASSCIDISWSISGAGVNTGTVPVICVKIKLNSTMRYTCFTRNVGVIWRKSWACLHTSPCWIISKPTVGTLRYTYFCIHIWIISKVPFGTLTDTRSSLIVSVNMKGIIAELYTFS